MSLSAETLMEKVSQISVKTQILLKRNRYLFKPFVALVLIYLLSLSALIRANFYYVDDLGRITRGNDGWDNYSRYISNFLSHFLHADFFLTDISPLTLFISVLELALASVILIRVFSSRNRVTAWQVIACIPLGLSPYFLECFSYRFDSPYMALSILAVILPLLCARRRIYVYWIAVLAGTLVMCMTYQASSGIFPMVVFMIAFKSYNEGHNKSWRFILNSALPYLLAMLVFVLLFMKPTTTNYASNALPEAGSFLSVVIYNFLHYYKYVLHDFKPVWLLIVGLIAICFVAVAIIRSKRNKFVTGLLAVVVLCMMALLVFGFYPLLNDPIFAPRAMYGVGVALCLMALYIADGPRAVVGKVASTALSWAFVVFAFTYGNALYLQGEWNEFRTEQAISEIVNCGMNYDETVQVYVDGTAGLAPALEGIPEGDQVMLRRLLRQRFGGPWGFNNWELFHFYGLDGFEHVKKLSGDELAEYIAMPILSDTLYETIRGDSGHLYIHVK